MVYYFKSMPSGHTLFMGLDKQENEHLIKHGWPEQDIWFHVDNLSSAHVYLRLNPDEDWQLIPGDLLEEVAQLTKANSIKGNKQNNITIIYTPHSNLHKDESMDTGTVSFKNPKLVRKHYISKRNNAILNRLDKTRTIKTVQEFKEEREAKDDADREALRASKAQERESEWMERERIRDAKHRKETMYADLFTDENMTQTNERFNEDDFW
ncbi:hypothetical protein BABINDRAFT_163937 [Babjeviella inositovora NRRL Y-12698]|uniref:NFACT RNA-binding domain-containing protein n=1 Tax=Babjeviella inositovora NRRL Y-12698 TaxID=984486 RepID=A0A1E3QIN3_9ASCO|nr:uncharacterized protein BABINDRAFT_163937 [Babjeviella inositovora NRRL Y-12698]ODQ76932.1 hypothetical protein BABINDRAFT_163937 [Babjeviella inositovora NRRL Y-12698]